MPSFAKIFSFAAVAFAAFASAAPMPADAPAVPAVPAAPTTPDVPALPSHGLTRRCGACADDGVPSLIEIIANLKADVDVHVKALAAVTVDTCTVAHIQPIAIKIVAAIDVAIEAIIKLGVYTTDKILFDGHAIVDIKVFAAVFAEVIVSICLAIKVVLDICLKLAVNIRVDIHAVLCLIGVAVARLIHVVCAIVGHLTVDLVAVLCIRLKACFWVFVQLKLVDLYVLLKINVKAFVGIAL